MEKGPATSYKTKHTPILGPRNSTPRYLLKKNKYTCTHSLYANVYVSLVAEPASSSDDIQQENGQLSYSDSKRLLDSKKKQTPNIYNVDESQTYCTSERSTKKTYKHCMISNVRSPQTVQIKPWLKKSQKSDSL